MKKNKKLITVDAERYVEGTPMQRPSSMSFNGHTPYVNWGVKNDYPELLLGLYTNSPTHSAAINFAVQVILGNGIDYEAMNLDGSETMPNEEYSWDELMRRVALDYCIFGQYAIEVIRNRDGQTCSFYHMPIHKVRYSQYNEEGNIDGYYVSSDWSNVTQYPPRWIDAFNSDVETMEYGLSYLFVYKTYSPSTEYYAAPNYVAGIKSIQAEVEFSKFDYKTSSNNFVPSGMLVLNETETEEEKRALIKEVQKMFVGSENANSVMISFRSNQEEALPEYIPFAANKSNVDLYDTSDIRNKVRILSAHQIPDPSLCGLPPIGRTGFASEADKMQMALAVYVKMVGEDNRRSILSTFNAMLALNGIETKVALKPFDFGFETNVINKEEQQ